MRSGYGPRRGSGKWRAPGGNGSGITRGRAEREVCRARHRPILTPAGIAGPRRPCRARRHVPAALVSRPGALGPRRTHFQPFSLPPGLNAAHHGPTIAEGGNRMSPVALALIALAATAD